ncbi:hypothetical protein [Sulfurospirillum cavolei]|uniref:hypothetical protein n=1 Tax=Sulfurospirillum cavolei TaxID=366522 RepID=UPI000764853A|nr:hypothetical protein [Sulfurospirillum cavolei]
MKKILLFMLFSVLSFAQDNQLFTVNTMGIEINDSFVNKEEIFCGRRSEYTISLAKLSHSTLSGTLDGLNAGSKAFNAGNVGVGLQNVGAGLGIGLAFGLIQFSIDKYKEDNQYMLVRVYSDNTNKATALISLLIVDKGLEENQYRAMLEEEQKNYIARKGK